MKNKITNPGSALGEAIGALIENNLNAVIKPIAEQCGCIHVSTGPINPKTGRTKKLILTDESGTDYNIDSVIANERLQPLVLIESKYIRYKKHNRDKGRWVCTAHTSLRRRYSSIRKSITVLAGSWSKTSKAMMESFDVTLFEIPFRRICDILGSHGITFDWAEKDRKTATKSWKTFQKLDELTIGKIGKKFVGPLEEDLRSNLMETLASTRPRSISKIELVITSNLGESRHLKFDSVADGLRFLQTFNTEKMLDTSGAPVLPAEISEGTEEVENNSEEVDEK